MPFHVRLQKERFVFSAGHFITFGDDICERLHGHNYHVAAEIHGALGDNHYVIDFIVVRDALQEIVDRLDHHMLLPTEHPTIQVEVNGDQVDVAHGDRRWSFPRGDCLLLPIANTTAELLAEMIANELAEKLKSQGIDHWERLRIEVDECDGQWAGVDRQRPAAGRNPGES